VNGNFQQPHNLPNLGQDVQYVVVADRFGYPVGGNPWEINTERPAEAARTISGAPASDLGFVGWVLFIIGQLVVFVFTNGLKGYLVGALIVSGLVGLRKLISWGANRVSPPTGT
jgi:hypothetical protein